MSEFDQLGGELHQARSDKSAASQKLFESQEKVKQLQAQQAQLQRAFDQITEVAAKNYYRWGAAVPMVIRAPYGGGVHGGPFHSECPEGWFFHSPGLKLVAPSTTNP